MLINEIMRVSGDQVVYHGAMEEFDTFDVSRIGENNRDYGGWGIYFSESEDIARQYTPVGKPTIMAFTLPSGQYFDLDDMMSEGLYRELMEYLEFYDEDAYEKTEHFREEIDEYGFDEYGLTGDSFYDIMSHDLGSRKNMSLFLKDFGFKGNTFLDRTDSSVRNYVLFSTNGLRKVR